MLTRYDRRGNIEVVRSGRLQSPEVLASLDVMADKRPFS